MKEKGNYFLWISVFMAVILSLPFCEKEPAETADTTTKDERLFEYGWFPEFPENIRGLNSEYDDFNSYLPVIGRRIDLYYSNNSHSRGKDFDISATCIDAFLNVEDSIFFFNAMDAPFYSYDLLPLVNTSNNELGPFGFETDSFPNNNEWIFLYASDDQGDFNIKFCYTNPRDWGHYNSTRKIHGPFDAGMLNSDSDDLYPTINQERDKFFFSSDRNGNFDIFEVGINESSVAEWLLNGDGSPELNELLSGDYDDKCPYINGNLMVFTSNRPGGYGGFDLWFSIFYDGHWNEPLNFGSRINTEFDEYRPATEYFPYSNNDLLVFSSNRPGGKGGFDLYYAGISRRIK